MQKTDDRKEESDPERRAGETGGSHRRAVAARRQQSRKGQHRAHGNQQASQRKIDEPVREQHGKEWRCGSLVRNQQNKAGEQQYRQKAELNIGATLQKSVPPDEVLHERHERREQRGQNQDSAAALEPTCIQALSPLCVLVA